MKYGKAKIVYQEDYQKIDGFLKGKILQTKISQLNIESSWKFIAGGLNQHDNGFFLNKYGMIHILRHIDGYFCYPPTLKLKQLLRTFSIESPEFWSSQDRTKFNLILKKKNIQDSIQIEHLNGGVKGFIELIMDKKELRKHAWDANELADLHAKHVRCCYKLKSENSLNERVYIDQIERFEGVF